MVNLAKVYIWGEYAGAVLWNENTGSATFEYEPSFAKKGWISGPFFAVFLPLIYVLHTANNTHPR